MRSAAARRKSGGGGGGGGGGGSSYRPEDSLPLLGGGGLPPRPRSNSSHSGTSVSRTSTNTTSSSISRTPSGKVNSGGDSNDDSGPHRSESEVTLLTSGSRHYRPRGNGGAGVHIPVDVDPADSSLGSAGSCCSSKDAGSNQVRLKQKLRHGSNGSISRKRYPKQHCSPADENTLVVKRPAVVYTAMIFCMLAILLCAKMLLWPSAGSTATPGGSDINDDNSRNEHGSFGERDENKGYQNQQPFDSRGRIIWEDFDAKPPFSDFLPAVAGIYGKPIWSFYVNRGQCIASFGTQSKDYPIMEFNSANKAYQSTAALGFRTFLRIIRRGHSVDMEPFSPTKTRWEGANTKTPTQKTPNEFSSLPKRFMYIGSNEMQIRELDVSNKIETNVTFFSLPEEDFGSLVRRTTVTNLDLSESMTLSMLDGLVRMEPAGGALDGLLKVMGRTLEGFFGVDQASMRDDVVTMPFYRMSTEATDSAAVRVQQHGHYALSFVESEKSELLPIIYDTSKIFGEDTQLLHPVGFLRSSVEEMVRKPQYGHAKTSSAFAAVETVTIPPGGSITIASFYGKVGDITDVPVIARRITAPGFVEYKFTRAIELVNQITQSVETQTGSQAFNGHVQQMYLDNSLRGGIPIILGAKDDNTRVLNADEDKRLKVYHLFSRVHGDLERDYNNFIVEPTYFSEGPGNFRDVAQNRRNDIFFSPQIGTFHIKTFLSYVQADAYQPNRVEAIIFSIGDRALCDKLATNAVGHADGHRAQRELLSSVLCNGPFRPGQLFSLIEDLHIELIMDRQAFIDAVAAVAETQPSAVFSQGYWADHFTYYIDLISSYQSIYPEKIEEALYNDQLGYFFSPAHVKPRNEKYVLSEEFQGKGKHVRQLEATVVDESKMRERKKYFNKLTGWYDPPANWQHDMSGRMFTNSPIEKLFLLVTLKFATRDAYGMGIEYEAGKPGWNDAMNGLPGMIGSGMPETFELILLLKFVLSVVERTGRSLFVPLELAVLVSRIDTALKDLEDSGYADEKLVKLPAEVPIELFAYWDAVSTAREEYRESVKISFTGKKEEIVASDAAGYLSQWLQQLEFGKNRASKVGSHGDGDNGDSGIVPTYFAYNCTKWNKTGKENGERHSFVEPLAFAVRRFPLFLEGPSRLLKTVDEENEALKIYERVRKSALRDKELNLYTVSASLKGQSFDIGRIMAFASGWLQNQSVWMHMSYKFYLELIKHGLYDQFFDEMKTGMLPFINSSSYGRSSMECSSFIASSTFEDPSQRGRGFLARLSGSTAEFLSIWVIMMIGPEPFFVDKETKQLCMKLTPALPLSLFQKNSLDESSTKRDEELTVSFKLFTSINVTYHNEKKINLYGESPKRYEVGLRDGSRIEIKGPTIPTDLAVKIRRVVFVDCIDAYF